MHPAASCRHIFYTGNVGGANLLTHFFAYGEEIGLEVCKAFPHFSSFFSALFFSPPEIFKRRRGSRLWMRETDWTASCSSCDSPRPGDSAGIFGVGEKESERDWARYLSSDLFVFCPSPSSFRRGRSWASPATNVDENSSTTADEKTLDTSNFTRPGG